MHAMQMQTFTLQLSPVLGMASRDAGADVFLSGLKLLEANQGHFANHFLC